VIDPRQGQVTARIGKLPTGRVLQALLCLAEIPLPSEIGALNHTLRHETRSADFSIRRQIS